MSKIADLYIVLRALKQVVRKDRHIEIYKSREIEISDTKILNLSNTESISTATIETYDIPKTYIEPVIQLKSPNSEINTHNSEIQTPQIELKESRIPTWKISRLYQFGSLAIDLGLNIVGNKVQYFYNGEKKPFLNEANIAKIVSSLSHLRGAAQKLGQIISIHDSNMLSPELGRIFNKLQNSGNAMPQKQLQAIMVVELGENWLDRFEEFNMKPFSAASIGQVHKATLNQSSDKSSTNVAVKVQYPGIAKSIKSDLSTVKNILIASSLLPKGLFLDKTIDAADRELEWETDYTRELEFGKKFKSLLTNFDQYKVPIFFEDLCTSKVLVMEYCNGITFSNLDMLNQETRNLISKNVLQLCLLEIFQFGAMQTDPNFSNFLYDQENHKIVLLDFGASREYDVGFLKLYCQLLNAAIHDDHQKVLIFSRDIGYLTGNESKSMEAAHVESILLLASPFRSLSQYDFEYQNVSTKIRDNIPLILNQRLTPPPHQTYGIHRKLSGAFMLASKLKAKINCRDVWDQSVKNSPFL